MDGRKWELQLYPDSDSYNFVEVISKAKEYFEEYAYALHDKDIDDSTGELKKAHVHFYGFVRTSRQEENIANILGIPVYHVRQVKKKKNALRYLVHYDSKDKYQYSRDIICTNMNLDKYFTDDSMAKVSQLFDLILNSKPRTQTELVKLVLDNGLWSEYRRAASTWVNVMHEIDKGV